MLDWLTPDRAELAGTAALLGAAFLVDQHRRAPKKPIDLAVPRETRPGWLARHRASRGLRSRSQHVAVGYTSAWRAMHVTPEALIRHGTVLGTTGSGKTTMLRRVVQDWDGPIIALDPKGSTDLQDAFWAEERGHVWRIGDPLQLDMLHPEPSIAASQLLEGEIFTDRGEVYRNIAEHACQWAVWCLNRRGLPRTPQGVQPLVTNPTRIRDAIRATCRDFPPPAAELARAQEVARQFDEDTLTTREALDSFGHRLGSLIDSPAGRSLGMGPMALTLRDVADTNAKLLLSLDPSYGANSRKIGAWALVAMIRLASELRQERWGLSHKLLLLLDEPALLGHQARHLGDLLATARDAGLGLLVADQGADRLSVIHPDMPAQVMRGTAWQLVLRQGSPADAQAIAALFGQPWHQAPRVDADWLLSLPPGLGWLRVVPTRQADRERVASIAVAQPQPSTRRQLLALPAPIGPLTPPAGGEAGGAQGVVPAGGGGVKPQMLRDYVYARIDAPAKAIGEDGTVFLCRRWNPPGIKEESKVDKDGYPKCTYQRKAVSSLHRRVYEWEHPGESLDGLEVHHLCGHRWCLEVAHLKPKTRRAHVEEEAERRRGNKAAGAQRRVPKGDEVAAVAGDAAAGPGAGGASV